MPGAPKKASCRGDPQHKASLFTMIFFSLLFPCYLRSGRSAGVSFWGSTGVGGDRLKAYSYSMMTFWFVGYIVVCIINLPQHIYVLYELFCFTNIFWVNNWSPPEGQGDYTLISSSAYRISSSTVISAANQGWSASLKPLCGRSNTCASVISCALSFAPTALFPLFL